MKVHVFDDTFSGEAEAQLTDFHNSVKEVPFFQSVGFFNAASGVKGYRPVFFVVTDHEGNIAGTMLANHIRILPFKCRMLSYTLITGGPVLNKAVHNKTEILGVMLDKLQQECGRKALFTEFRNLMDMSEYRDTFEKHGFAFEDWLNSEIDTSDADAMLSEVQKNKQTQIREAAASGINTRQAENEGEVRTFYGQLKRFYTFRLHKPLPPLPVFINLFRQSVASQQAVPVIVSVYKGRIIGGMICPQDNTSMYEWYICTENQGNTDLYTGVATTWGGIENANQRGLHYFNFMGLGKPGKEYGVRRFKKQFGGTESNFGRYYYFRFRLLYQIVSKI